MPGFLLNLAPGYFLSALQQAAKLYFATDYRKKLKLYSQIEYMPKFSYDLDLKLAYSIYY